jgi:hypothetical protein
MGERDNGGDIGKDRAATPPEKGLETLKLD